MHQPGSAMRRSTDTSTDVMESELMPSDIVIEGASQQLIDLFIKRLPVRTSFLSEHLGINIISGMRKENKVRLSGFIYKASGKLTPADNHKQKLELKVRLTFPVKCAFLFVYSLSFLFLVTENTTINGNDDPAFEYRLAFGAIGIIAFFIPHSIMLLKKESFAKSLKNELEKFRDKY